MAKAIEDTAYYRYVRLVGLNEVGGDPTRVGVPTQDFHEFAQDLLGAWPQSMTTLSTHDTKRAEDVRARLFVLAERPEAWATWVRTARELAAPGASRGRSTCSPSTSCGRPSSARGRSVRTGCRPTPSRRSGSRSSTRGGPSPTTAYESAVERFVSGVVTTPEIVAHVESWVESTRLEARANVLGQKLVQLTMPGVPDVYQGTDLVDLSLVDPDNRRAVDYAERRDRLARLDGGGVPADLHDEKLLVTSAALRTRRERADFFTGENATYLPVATTSEHAVAFGRGTGEAVEVVTVVTRLAGRLADAGGYGEATVELPEGRWSDVISSRTFDGGPTPLADVVGAAGLPVALLVRVRDES